MDENKIIDKLREFKRKFSQLCHLSNILTKFDDCAHKNTAQGRGIKIILNNYYSYLTHMMRIDGYSESEIRQKVTLLNRYYDFFRVEEYDTLFSAQGKFRSTILEEFLFLLFKDYINNLKIREKDERNVLKTGGVKAYSNIYFRAADLKQFIHDLSIEVNEKDQDYAIYRSCEISVDGVNKTIRIPAVAIEAKTYIDKTMLDGIIATAEKVKSGNPHCRFIAVAERYDVSKTVDPAYSRVDQIYVLRKSMRKSEWCPIDSSVVLRLFNEVVKHLNSPWSDVAKKIEEEGIVI